MRWTIATAMVVAMLACGSEPLVVPMAPACGPEVYEALMCQRPDGTWDRRFSLCNGGAVVDCALYGLHETEGSPAYTSYCVAVCP